MTSAEEPDEQFGVTIEELGKTFWFRTDEEANLFMEEFYSTPDVES